MSVSALIAAPRIRTSSNSSVFGYRATRFWAERGLIHIVDEDTGAYTPCSRAEWVARIIAFAGKKGRINDKYADERAEKRRLIQSMIETNAEAKRQGDPFDPRVSRDMMSRGPATISMAGTYRPGQSLILPGTPPPAVAPKIIVP